MASICGKKEVKRMSSNGIYIISCFIASVFHFTLSRVKKLGKTLRSVVGVRNSDSSFILLIYISD